MAMEARFPPTGRAATRPTRVPALNATAHACPARQRSISGSAAASALPGAVSVDAIFEVFNLLNRTNFTEANNIFGVGAYPADPLPTFGQFSRPGSPRQVQLGVKVNF